MISRGKRTTSGCASLLKLAILLCFSAGVFALSAAPVNAQQPPRPQRKGDKTASPALPATKAQIERGKYLVNNVAMCPQCHSPRLSDGSIDPSRLLDGAPELFQPPNPDPNWPIKAPRIGGNPPASDADMVKLLMTGIWTDGKPLRLPMMPFRMNEADAKAVVAYLHSVKQEH